VSVSRPDSQFQLCEPPQVHHDVTAHQTERATNKRKSTKQKPPSSVVREHQDKRVVNERKSTALTSPSTAVVVHQIEHAMDERKPAEWTSSSTAVGVHATDHDEWFVNDDGREEGVEFDVAGPSSTTMIGDDDFSDIHIVVDANGKRYG
jgi:hypothetical protein